jgi:hypothetical protein
MLDTQMTVKLHIYSLGARLMLLLAMVIALTMTLHALTVHHQLEHASLTVTLIHTEPVASHVTLFVPSAMDLRRTIVCIAPEIQQPMSYTLKISAIVLV